MNGNLIYNNHTVTSLISVSFENYFTSLNAIKDLYLIVNLGLLGMPWNAETEKIFGEIEKRNEKRIWQAKIIMANIDLSRDLLDYCRKYGAYKSAAEDRTYELAKLFFTNVGKYMKDKNLEEVDWTKFWLPTGVNEQGEVQGEEIDICRIYANICNAEEKILKEQMNSNNGLEGILLKQEFSKKVNTIALSDYDKRIAPIPSYLVNKKAEYVKTKLENIANAIQKYTYREKRFPDEFIPERFIKLYSDVIDLYIRNPEQKISELQSNEYKEIAKVKNQIS